MAHLGRGPHAQGDEAFQRLEHLLGLINDDTNLPESPDRRANLVRNRIDINARDEDDSMLEGMIEETLGTHRVMREYRQPETIPNMSVYDVENEEDFAIVEHQENMFEEEDLDMGITLQMPRGGSVVPPLGLRHRTQVEAALRIIDENVALTEFLHREDIQQPNDTMEDVDDNAADTVYGNRETLLQNHLFWFGRTGSLGSQAATQRVSVRSTFEGQQRLDREMLLRQVQERDTWLLMYMLTSGKNLASISDMESEGYNFESALMANYANDDEFQRWDVICRWMQLVWCTDKRLSLAENGVRGKYRPSTVHSLKTPSNYIRTTTSNLVERADPDADIRSNDRVEDCRFHADDVDDQILLLEQIWSLIRSGALYTSSQSVGERLDDFCLPAKEQKLNDLVERACFEHGEPWRMASLSGGAILSTEQLREDDTPHLVGNPYRSVWKETCVKLSEKMHNVSRNVAESSEAQAYAALLESSIYAILGGNVQSVLNSELFSQWRVHCWAVFRSKVQAKVDQFCINHRSFLEDQYGHMRGPRRSNDSPENHVYRRAELTMNTSEEAVFDEIAGKVNEDETFFFTIQRALIEGRFHNLFQSEFEQSGMDLCEYLCGSALNDAVENFYDEVIGNTELRQRADATARSRSSLRDATVSPTPSAEGECWRLKHRSEAAQMLRFTTHATLFMVYSASPFCVVKEERKVLPKVSEALVLAYIKYLLGDGTNAVQRLMTIPVFYPSFVTNPSKLKVVVHSALMETAAGLPIDQRMSIMQAWTDTIKPFHIIAQAARQAYRNIRMRWLSLSHAPQFIREPAVRNSVDRFTNSEENTSNGDVDPRIRIRETWWWLAMHPKSRGEAFVQANAFIRDLIFAWASSDQGGYENVMVAFNFYNEDVVPLLSHNLDRAREDIVHEEEDAPTLTMSPISTDAVVTEREHLGLFLDLSMMIWEWKNGIARIEAEHGLHPTLPNEDMTEILYRANDISDRIEILLSQHHGWLPFEPNAARPMWPEEGERVEVVEQDEEITQELELRAFLYGTSRDGPGALRKLVIPFIIERYMDVCNTAARYSELADNSQVALDFYQKQVRIVNLIAKENLRISVCYELPMLRDLLERVRRAANNLVRIEDSLH